MSPNAPALDPTHNDAERLAVEAAQRDPARFDELYEANFERVYAYVARRVRDRDVACDLTAEVFHRALEHLGRFEWRGVPFVAWLLRIAAHAIADRATRAGREGRAAEVQGVPSRQSPRSTSPTRKRGRISFAASTRCPPTRRASSCCASRRSARSARSPTPSGVARAP
jgi:DNA-directed RNA polymerase specialized sigma24 family protein